MKRLFFLITLLLLALILLFSLISCKKEAEFDTLLICDEIDEKTLEAVNIKNVFEIDNETIYAVIKYSGAYMKDSYFFVWTNLDTGKKKTTEKYFFANKENLESGNLVSVLKLKEESPAITPGKYKVEFIYNGNLKSTSEFEISRPEMKIITTELASKLSEDGSPFESTEKFEQTDTINLSINVNYILKNNNFKIRWFDNKDKIIKENLYVVNKDDYKNKYITFPLQSGKGLFPEGDYEVDIYFNEALIKTLSFNIKKTELNLSSFLKKSEYANKERGFSFLIPDNWDYLEFEKEGQFQVQIVPPLSNMEIGFLFLVASNTDDFSEDSLSELPYKILSSFISEKGLIEKEVRTETGTIVNEIGYKEITNIYTDSKGDKWLLPFCLIVHDNNLYILYGIINETMFSEAVADEIFYGIINSIDFN